MLVALISTTGLSTVPLESQDASNYVIGAQDVLTVSVYGQDSLTGKFTVEADGTFSFPLLGRVKAAGLTLRAFENELKRLLADGYLRNPQLSVAIEQYRSQRIFIMGDVRQSGTYPLTGGMSLIEALSTAGVSGKSEVVVVRSSKASGPLAPGVDSSAEVIRIDVRALQNGDLRQNIPLRDGDTVFVPSAETVYVFGHVKNPGGYPATKETTVLQALALAGGVSETGAIGRIKIVRIVNGEQKDIKVKLTDIARPGDVIVVPQRYF